MPVCSDIANVLIYLLTTALLGCSSALIDPDAGDSAANDTGVAGDTGDTGVGGDSGDSDTGPTDTGAADSRVPDSRADDTGTIDGAMDMTPGAGDLVISELMPDSHAAGDSLGEWFELHNPSATMAYSLDGCSFYDSGGAVERPTGVVIAPGQYMSFAISPSPGFTPDYVYMSGMRLANPPDPDSLTIACGAVIIDTVAYLPYPTWPWGQGESLSLDPASLNTSDNDFVTSWCPGVGEYNRVGADIDHGTPGMPNPDC